MWSLIYLVHSWGNESSTQQLNLAYLKSRKSKAGSNYLKIKNKIIS
jgi:hypothetical protein